MLNPAKRSHREKFKEKLEEQLKIYNIERELVIAQEKPTYQDVERIDELIMRVLNFTRKKVEGNKRNIPFSKEKYQRRAKLLYWKAKIRSMKGKVID